MSEIHRTMHIALTDSLRPGVDFFDEAQDIERALVPIYIFDAENHAILAANAAAQRLYGYSEAEFLSLSLFDIRPPEEVEPTRRCLAAGWPKGLRHSGVWRHRAKCGRVFTVSAMGLSIGYAGRPAVLAIITDLTPTLRVPGNARAGHAIFPFAEQMEEMVCWIRSLADNRLVYVNPAFEHVYGLSIETAYADQDAVMSLAHPEDIEALRRYAFRTTWEPARLEYRIRHPDGEWRWLASRSFPLIDAAGEKMLAGFVEDITERKQAEQHRLKALEDQRDALVREVHHRIKNSLQGATGLLSRAAAARPQLAPALAEVSAQLRSLATVHGLQARTASGRVELCDLLRGIAAAAESLGPTRLALAIPAECEPCMAVAEKDAVPLALALNELATNAVKHAGPGGAVRLDAEVDPAAGAAEIRIANPGRLPPGAGKAFGGGSGLELVRMLLPPRGARFVLGEADGTVTATLRLKAPVLQPCG